MVTICTTSLTFNHSTFCSHTVFMCFVWISEQTAIISLYNINWLVFITETESVYCAVRTGSLCIILVNDDLDSPVSTTFSCLSLRVFALRHLFLCSPTFRNHVVVSYSTEQIAHSYWWRSYQFSVYRGKYYHWSVYCKETTALLKKLPVAQLLNTLRTGDADLRF